MHRRNLCYEYLYEAFIIKIMKTSLKHLPEQKQRELQRAIEIIREEIDPDMLILFGSYARGDWVEDLDPETLLYRYQSDFDLLIITETPREANKIEQNSQLAHKLAKTIHRTPISLIAEDIRFVNRRLVKSQYFYIDILREGVLLYNSGKFELAEPRELTGAERGKLAEEDFEQWFKGVIDFIKTYKFHYAEEMYNLAAFDLHQATEKLYGTILLVFTRYKPSTHDLEKLSQRVNGIEPRFLSAFPKSTEVEKECFKLLRKAYVDARYKPSYTITHEQLQWLAERVALLKELTEKLCREKIESFR